MIGSAIGAAVSVGGSLLAGSSAKSAAKTQAQAAHEAAQAQLQAAQIAANTSLGIYGSTKASLMPFTTVGTSALNQLAMMWGLPTAQTPTAQSQVPIIPGLNDGSQGGFGSPGGSGGFPGIGGGAPGGMAAGQDPSGGAGVGPSNGQPGVPNFSAMLAALTQTPGYQFGLQQGQQALERGAAARGMVLSGAQLQDAQKFGTDYAIAAGWSPYVNQLNSFASLGENAAAGAGSLGVQTAGQIGSALQTGAANAGSANISAANSLAAGQLGAGNALSGALGGLGTALLSNRSSYGGGSFSNLGSPDAISNVLANGY